MKYFSSNNWLLGVWASFWFSNWEVSRSLKPWGSSPASVLLWLPLLVKALFSSLLEPPSPPWVLPLDSVNALGQAGRGWLFPGVRRYTWKGLAEATVGGFHFLFQASLIRALGHAAHLLLATAGNESGRKSVTSSRILFWPRSPSRCFPSSLCLCLSSTGLPHRDGYLSLCLIHPQ